MAAANHVGGPADARGGLPPAALLSTIAARYRLAEVLGRGGEGDTFAAVDEMTGRPCAVKVFRGGEPHVLARVRGEFERLVGVDHPGVARVLALGRDQGRLYLVSELVAGNSVAAIAETPDENRRSELFVRAAREICDALGYLHSRGVIHGDVSPENVRLTDGGRAVLIDLGASGHAEGGAAVGTLGFAAPESLIGKVTPLSDLFGMGATLFSAWTGTGPFGVGVQAVNRMLSGPPPRITTVRAGLSEEWAGLIDRLLQSSPERRPSSARVVLREIGRLAPAAPGPDGRTRAAAVTAADMLPPFPSGDALSGIFVGRENELSVLRGGLERLAEGTCLHAVIAAVGPEGSGRRTLLDAALQHFAIAQVAPSAIPVAIFQGGLATLASWLGMSTGPPSPEKHPDVQDDPVREREKLFTRIAAALDARSARDPLCVAIDSGADELAFASFAAGAPASGRWVILLATTAPVGRVGALDLPLPAFSKDDVRALVARAAGDDVSVPDAIDAVAAAAAGHAATAAALVRQLVEAVRLGDIRHFKPIADQPLATLLAAAFGRLTASARRLLAAVVLGIPNLSDDEPADASAWRADCDAARASGWLAGEFEVRIPSPVHEGIVIAALGTPDLREVVENALALLPVGDGRRGICLEALGRIDLAVAAFHAAANKAAANDASAPAASVGRWLREAARLAPASLDIGQRLTLATSLALAGRPDDALAALDVPDDARDGAPVPPQHRLRLAERRAWLLGRAGNLEGGRLLLQSAIDQVGAADVDGLAEPLAASLARLARLLVSLGRYRDALTVAEPLLTTASVNPLAVESVLLAHAYSGDLPAARRLRAEVGPQALAPARASYIAALVEHLAGNLQASLELYRGALAQADATSDVHTTAAIALNMAALAAEAGRYDEALRTQDRAIRELGRLGATAELATALFNGAMLSLDLGDHGGARDLLARLRTEVGADATAGAAALVAFLEGELAMREGNDGVALQSYAAAAQAAGANVALRMAADFGRAELLARAQRTVEAQAVLDQHESRTENARLAADFRLARGRVALAGPAVEVDAAARLAASLEADAVEAAGGGRKPFAWRAALAAARLFHRAGMAARTSAALASARNNFEEVRMSTPVDHRPGIEHEHEARLLADLTRLATGGDDAASTARGARAARAEDKLRRLLRINKRLNSELRLPRLLELIMDTVIELTEAERGFILLEDEKGELAVKVARNIDQQSLETGAFEWSRSIARQAATGGAPIVTIDAAGDPRFREALSVSDLHLRSVLAVPLQVKNRAVGTLYVDNRLRKGAFGEDDIQLVLDFAEQAGIAIENTRLLSELRRRERQIEVLNRRLESELAVRKEELVGMKQELRENREALAIRYDYRNIVGRTPRMLDLFRLLDRLTDTTLPVVIQGESGTGKELVARALHFNGPRRDRPFVSENCAAIPETLLESTLFGSVKGAFTGADHDSRGLFEVADGGTLFLDEVGEMSAAMQGKLLRVLQAGELRRVGSERTRRVDVRIVAATNRDLGRMVEEGRFRQDLFFRLAVAPIVLPPLRDRREDIPAIVEHVLVKLAAAASTRAGGDDKKNPAAAVRRVDPAAMARLAGYRWPGNVRELENELMRAAALCNGPITVADLSPHVAGDAEAALSSLGDPDDLTLRPRVERLERALLKEAMSRAGGNQTRAAEALGLSRFGLQKKLRRYQMGQQG